jgi:hypothetical protein
MGSTTTPQPTKPTILDIETLNAVGARLFEHADAITGDIAVDLRLSARICDRLASLRSRVTKIAQLALAHPEWDRAAFARDLRDALKRAEDGEDLPEPNRASQYS